MNIDALMQEYMDYLEKLNASKNKFFLDDGKTINPEFDTIIISNNFTAENNKKTILSSDYLALIRFNPNEIEILDSGTSKEKIKILEILEFYGVL